LQRKKKQKRKETKTSNSSKKALIPSLNYAIKEQ